MMKRLKNKMIAITLLLLVGSNNVFAQGFERIVLQDGSSYDGYISKQIVGKSFTFTTVDGQQWNFEYERVKEVDKAPQQGHYIIDQITYNDSVVRGQIIKNVLGEYLTLQLQGQSRTIQIPVENIVKQERLPFSNRSYREDSPFIETVITKSQKIYTGFIVIQSYDDEKLTVKEFNGDVSTIGLSDIDVIYKKVNRGCSYKGFPVEIEERTTSDESNSEYDSTEDDSLNGILDNSGHKVYIFDHEGIFSEVKATNDDYCYIDSCISVIKIRRDRIKDSLTVSLDNQDTAKLSLLGDVIYQEGAYLFKVGTGKEGSRKMQGSKLEVTYDVRRGNYALYRKDNNTAVIISIK